MEVRSSIRYEALGVFSQPEAMARLGSAGITSGLRTTGTDRRWVGANGLGLEIASHSVVRMSAIPKPRGELNRPRDCCQHTSDAHSAD